MKSKFEPDLDSGLRLPPAVRLIDPEAYDASEQRFAASVEEKVGEKTVPRRFVVDAVQEPQATWRLETVRLMLRAAGMSPVESLTSCQALLLPTKAAA